MTEFKLNSDFIELDNLLKVLNLVAGGSQARELIRQGQVAVNAAAETRLRRKIRAGDVVRIGEQEIRIVA